MTHLEALRAAVLAKIAYWDAMTVLEEALGSESAKIAEFVSDLAAGANDDASNVEEYHVVHLLGEIA